MDADLRLTHVSYLCDPVFKFMDLFSIQSMAKTDAFVGVVWREIFDAEGGPFEVFKAHFILNFVVSLQG